MERRTSTGVFYSNERLGVEEQELPLTFHSVPEGREERFTRKGQEGWQVGFMSPACDKSKELGFIGAAVIFDGTTSVDCVSPKSINRKIDCPSTKEPSMIETIPDFLPKEIKLPDKGVIYQ